MSRGHGAIQRKILDLLFRHSLQPRPDHERDTYLSVFDLAEEMTPDDQEYLDNARIESIRRAVKKLEAEGEVETRTLLVRRNWSRSDRGTIKRMLCARLPLGDDDTAFYRQRAQQQAAEINALLSQRR